MKNVRCNKKKFKTANLALEKTKLMNHKKTKTKLQNFIKIRIKNFRIEYRK